jgi:hypothetical protein
VPLSFSNRFWQWVHRRYIALSIDGTPIGLVHPTPDELTRCEGRLREALSLIDSYAPRASRDRRRLKVGILLFRSHGALGEYYRDAALIKLKEQFVLDSATSATMVASLLVHELTHAWLEDHGVSYVSSRRARIERICFRAELIFAARAPDGKQLMPLLQRQFARPDTDWSEAALADRWRDEALALGLPRWIVSALLWVRRRRVV